MPENLHHIQIKIESYGAVEKLLAHDIVMNMQKHILVKDVVEQLKALHPNASDMLDRCACAIEDNIISRQEYLERDCILVLLSPVAGG